MKSEMEIKLLEELIEHMRELQGKGLKSRMECGEGGMPGEKIMEGDPKGMEGAEAGMPPKGVSIEKVELVGKKPGMHGSEYNKVAGLPYESSDEKSMEGKDGEEMTDDEIAELLKKMS